MTKISRRQFYQQQQHSIDKHTHTHAFERWTHFDRSELEEGTELLPLSPPPPKMKAPSGAETEYRSIHHKHSLSGTTTTAAAAAAPTGALFPRLWVFFLVFCFHFITAIISTTTTTTLIIIIHVLFCLFLNNFFNYFFSSQQRRPRQQQQQQPKQQQFSQAHCPNNTFSHTHIPFHPRLTCVY